MVICEFVKVGYIFLILIFCLIILRFVVWIV